ncbi:MAG: 4a-hydroxytetrahydrobiopterin dehydratase [Candidatus Obscuribacterales bacterium]|jgi:4a-hydroxytetrahydrobiopterin dehydratase
MKLSERECIPCRGGVPALPGEECLALLAELEGWKIVDGLLTKSYKFRDFRGALELANLIGDLADKVDHHPDLHVYWGVLKVDIFTHAIKGLTESDFVLAAKIDLLKD